MVAGMKCTVRELINSLIFAPANVLTILTANAKIRCRRLNGNLSLIRGVKLKQFARAYDQTGSSDRDSKVHYRLTIVT